MSIPGFSAEMALSTDGLGYRQSVKVLADDIHISLVRAAAISTQQCELESTLTVEEAGGTTTYNNYVCTTTVSGGVGGGGGGPGAGPRQPSGPSGGGGGKPNEQPTPEQKRARAKQKCESNCLNDFITNTFDCVNGNNDKRCSQAAKQRYDRCLSKCVLLYG